VVEGGGNVSVECWNGGGVCPPNTSTLKSVEVKNWGLEVGEILPWRL